jgi:hypothetical protein
MKNTLFEKHANLAFSLVGGMTGIIGGLLIDFCLISFFRWLDFYNAEIKIHPNTIPLSTDFWIFIFCIVVLFGLLYGFYCILIKFLASQKTPQEKNVIPNLVNPHLDYTAEISERESYKIILKCFTENSSLFTIIASVAASITLIQVFAIFLLGENWLTTILSGPFGLPTLILIIVSLYGIIGFTYYMLWLIAIHFYWKIFKNKKIRLTVRIEATIFLSLGLLAVGCIFLYLFFAWFAKLEILTALLGFDLFILIVVVPLIFLLISYYWNLHSQAQTCFWKALTLAGIVFLIIFLLISSIITIQGISGINDDITKYHSDKTILVKFNADKVNRDNATPTLLLLNKTTDSAFTKNFTFLDINYAECHWSTNYGYFVIISSNNSVIKKQYQELIVPGCGSLDDKTYWTYDIEDFGKYKPPVIIGLSVVDSIKRRNNSLGDARILLKWNTTDAADVYYNVSNFNSPF